MDLSFFDLELFWLNILGGIFFGLYVVWMGDHESTWKEILGWGIAVYVAFISLANLHRFIEGNPNAWQNLFTGTVRWFGFIFAILITAGVVRFILRQCRRC